MPFGYQGRILHVDLTNGKLQIENPPEEFYRKYVGGSAMGLYYILQSIKGKIDPLGPENILTLMLSPITGAPIAGQSRITANAISPLVDGIGDSQAGGFFPAEMKFAGFDGIVVRGQSRKPVYLWLKDGHAELRPANHLWGKTTTQVDDILKAELGDPKIEVAQCGPAGEKLAPLAAIINMANRANGRTGMGAVMGSKKLKAVVVRGSSKKLSLAHPQQFNALSQRGAKEIPNNSAMVDMHVYGTTSNVSWLHENGALPTFNFNAGQFDKYEAISGETMNQTILTERDSCYACAVRCKRVVETEWLENKVEKKNGGPEYETIATMGSYCGVGDLSAVSYANKVCNEYGLDTIGAGATVAWLMECFENGVVTEKEIGFPAHFGDATAMTRLIEMIAHREGIGDVLANGSRRAAEILGKGRDYLVQVKGAELPAHMPHYKRSLGLIYAVNPFGADHESSEHDGNIATDANKERLAPFGYTRPLPTTDLSKDKVQYAYGTQLFYSFLDSADLCNFVYSAAWALFGANQAVELVRNVTGWDDFSVDEMMQVGSRRLNMLRVANARLGIDRRADKLPEKLFKPLHGTGKFAGVALSKEEIERALDDYFALAGWDVQTGNPEPATLDKLGLGWLMD